MNVFIDTSVQTQTTIALGEFKVSSESKKMKSQMVLPLIEKLLHKQNRTLTDVTGITVATGPGSFTGLRVGIAVANALGFLLDIPVNGKKALVTPQY